MGTMGSDYRTTKEGEVVKRSGSGRESPKERAEYLLAMREARAARSSTRWALKRPVWEQEEAAPPPSEQPPGYNRTNMRDPSHRKRILANRARWRASQ